AELEAAVAGEGLTNGPPGEVRRRYHRIALTVVVVAVLGGIASLIFFGWLTFAVVLPFITLAVLGIVLMLLAQAMPARTRTGPLEPARWRAFRNSLARLPQESRPEAAAAAGRYLPYAVAFGLNRGWIERLASVGIWAPPWFRPIGQPGGPTW